MLTHTSCRCRTRVAVSKALSIDDGAFDVVLMHGCIHTYVWTHPWLLPDIEDLTANPMAVMHAVAGALPHELMEGEASVHVAGFFGALTAPIHSIHLQAHGNLARG